MASFVAVVVGLFVCCFFFLGGRGCYVLFKKGFVWGFFVCLFGFFSPFLMENL